MQVPEFWAEARHEGTVKGRRRVVRRFGWSDASQADAELQAETRAEAALAELQAGKRVPPREQKVPYGLAGLPIREQVVARNGDLVVTRNAYGARCLNEHDVLFADLDAVPALPAAVDRGIGWAALLAGLAMLVLAIISFATRHTGRGCFLLPMTLVAPGLLFALAARLRRATWSVARARRRMERRLAAFAERHRDGRFAVYATPAGLRVLALHRTFDPTGTATRELFAELGVDPAYAQMCELQACFRARLSAKPWRIGIARHIMPRPGVWPVREERRAERDAWIEQYEATAAGFAACRWREDFGDGRIAPRCAQVQRVHDELAKARSGLPIA